MGKSKRRLLITAIILVPLVTLFIVWAFVDAPPPEDSDLRITFDEIPAEENAFTYFDQAVEGVYWPEDQEERRRAASLLSEDGWDDALAAQILAENGGFFDTIEQGLDCPRFQVPEIKSFSTLLPYLSSWRTIARLGAIRAEQLCRQGEEQEAFEQAMQVVRFGSRVQGGRGALINWLVGTAMKEIGLKQLRRMLARTTLPADVLAFYMRALNETKTNGQVLAETLRVEYGCLCAAVDGLARGTVPFQEVCGGPICPTVIRVMPLKRNRTKRLFADAFRMLVANVSKPYADTVRPSLPRSYGTRYFLVALASGNGKGFVLYHVFLPAYLRAHVSKCRDNCVVSATQILVALRCYKTERGNLPDSLDELVPDYLESVPLDDFDGTPMKYSREEKVVYAVGPDLEDNGGIAANDREGIVSDDGYDVIYKIEF